MSGGDLLETYYLVDFENVASGGLKGCSELGKNDHIVIFYTDNTKSIDLDIVREHGKAEFKLYKVHQGNQYLDMHMSSYLGYIIGKHESDSLRIVLVSKDKDYDHVMEFWSELSDAGISRVNQISTKKKSTKTTSTKSGSTKKKTSGSSSKKNSNEMLIAEVKQAITGSGYTKAEAKKVASIVQKHYKENDFLIKVHTDLSREYSDYTQVYKAIKTVLKKYEKVDAEVTLSGEERTELNKKVQKLIKKSGATSEEMNGVASIVVKNYGEKNGKQTIYRSIVSKFGQKKGLSLYNQVKGLL